jgi:glycerol dehydrogenase-like iron-containing ADH family enzyme
MRRNQPGSLFPTVFGRNLIGELPNFVPWPYLVVTMEDLWGKFAHHFDGNMAEVFFVKTLEYETLVTEIDALPDFRSVIGLGGGQAVDVAKVIAWKRGLPLWHVPTSLSVNAPFAHRAGVRFGGNVRYMAWAVPEAVYIDYDVIQGAPAYLNRSGVGDIFCYHTAHYDWKYAQERGKCEAKWPYDEGFVADARSALDAVMANLEDIREVNENGIRVLTNAVRWGGAAFHNYGWNPRHIEGGEHFLFYTLEYLTRKPFIHGQPVSLGVYVVSALQDNKADEMLRAIHKVGVDIRPEAMGVTWDDVAEAMRRMQSYATEQGLWYSVVHEKKITEEFIQRIRTGIYDTFGPWK